MLLSVIIPSHKREYRIREMVGNWLAKAGQPANVTVWVACEMEDQRIYNERLADLAERVRVVPDDYGCYVEAVNRIAKASKGEAMIIAADDVVPCVDYDTIIDQAFRENFPRYDGVLKANDMIHTMAEVSNTHPIVGRAWYEAMGYVYYPGYFALGADTELANVSEQQNRMIRISHLVLEHQHHSVGKTPRDITHEKPLSQSLSGDRLLAARKAEGFPTKLKDGRFVPAVEVFNE